VLNEAINEVLASVLRGTYSGGHES
jgi:hypothetical protein